MSNLKFILTFLLINFICLSGCKKDEAEVEDERPLLNYIVIDSSASSYDYYKKDINIIISAPYMSYESFETDLNDDGINDIILKCRHNGSLSGLNSGQSNIIISDTNIFISYVEKIECTCCDSDTSYIYSCPCDSSVYNTDTNTYPIVHKQGDTLFCSNQYLSSGMAFSYYNSSNFTMGGGCKCNIDGGIWEGEGFVGLKMIINQNTYLGWLKIRATARTIEIYSFVLKKVRN